MTQGFSDYQQPTDHCRTVAVFIQAPAQDPLVCSDSCQLVYWLCFFAFLCFCAIVYLYYIKFKL